MAKLSPEALQKLADALPDIYETDPDRLVVDWEAAQQARSDVDRLQEVNRWYEESYKPWWQTYGSDFAEFQQWKQRPPEQPSHGAESIVTPSGPQIDWDSERAPRQVYDHFEDRLAELQKTIESRFTLTQAEIEARTEEVRRLMTLQEQAYGLINEATWKAYGESMGKPGWRPDIDIPKVVQHAQQYNIPDLRRAYEHYSQADREKDLERRAYERGKEEGTRAAAAQAVTTEMGNGTPYRHVNVPDRRRGYGIDQDTIIAAAQARSARRGAA